MVLSSSLQASKLRTNASIEDACNALCDSDDASVAAAALVRLGELCSQEARGQRIMDQPSSPRRSTPREVASINAAARCLAALEGGGFGTLVRVMELHLVDEDERVDAMGGISEGERAPGSPSTTLSFHEEAERKGAAEASLQVQRASCVLIRKLCTSEERRDTAANSGVIAAVANAMLAHPSDVALQAAGCRVLHELALTSNERGERTGAFGDEVRCMRAVEEGALDVLAVVLYTYSRPSELGTSAATSFSPSSAASPAPFTASLSPARGRASTAEGASRASVLKQAALAVLAITYGSVIRAHEAVRAGVIVALQRASVSAATKAPHAAEKLDLAREWLEMQARLLGVSAPPPPRMSVVREKRREAASVAFHRRAAHATFGSFSRSGGTCCWSIAGCFEAAALKCMRGATVLHERGDEWDR